VLIHWHRDYDEKVADYAADGIAEYWIVDADRQLVVIYRLDGGN
jgi:Uma2 family endonuclease